MGVILAAFLVLTGFLARERWWTYDDVEDIRGTWVVQSEEALGNDVATIRITDRAIVLDINTTYVYTLNTKKKTIDFAFPPMDLTGQGHYRFSADRTRLIIVDGKYGWFSTCTSDFWWQVRSWWAKATGGAEPALGPEENATWLVRMDAAESASSTTAGDATDATDAIDATASADSADSAEGEAPAEDA